MNLSDIQIYLLDRSSRHCIIFILYLSEHNILHVSSCVKAMTFFFPEGNIYSHIVLCMFWSCLIWFYVTFQKYRPDRPNGEYNRLKINLYTLSHYENDSGVCTRFRGRRLVGSSKMFKKESCGCWILYYQFWSV